MYKDGNVTDQTLNAINDLFTRIGGNVLGVVKDEYEQQNVTDDMRRYELAIGGFIELRNEARRKKNFALSDKIRDILGSGGNFP